MRSRVSGFLTSALLLPTPRRLLCAAGCYVYLGGRGIIEHRSCQAWRVSDRLRFDPIAEAGRQWRKRWGSEPVAPMEAVTSVMRVQQILLARCNAGARAVRPHVRALRGADAAQLHPRRDAAAGQDRARGSRSIPASVTNLIDGLERLGYARRSRTRATGARPWPRSPITGGRGRRRHRGDARHPLRDRRPGRRRSSSRSPRCCAGCGSPRATSDVTATDI